MSGTDLYDGFARLVDDEPPMSIDITPVVTKGRRLRTRRRMGYAAGSLGVIGLTAAVIAIPLVLANDDSGPRLNIAPVAAPANPTAADDNLTAQQQRILAAIKESSPDGFTFEANAARWNGPNLEGVVDDGTGPGRFMLGVSPKNGSQLLHPCRDSEYRQGGTCTERLLAGGSVLSLRGMVDFKGIRYTDVALTHPDGGGLSIETGNFTITWPPPSVATAEQKRNLTHISRDTPAYTVEQLAAVVLAIDRVLNG
jgi:hypothetical protein